MSGWYSRYVQPYEIYLLIALYFPFYALLGWLGVNGFWTLFFLFMFLSPLSLRVYVSLWRQRESIKLAYLMAKIQLAEKFPRKTGEDDERFDK